MSAVLDVSRPTPLRLLGFLFTAVGGLLIAWGAVSDWATVVFQGRSFADSATKGVDTVEGKVALAIGVVLLVAIVLLRLVRSTGGRRAIALVVCVGALGAIGIAAVDIVQADQRFTDVAVDRLAREDVAANGGALDAAREQIQRFVDQAASIDIGVGLWLVLAGGIVGLVGGGLDLAWVGQQRLREAGVSDDDAA